MASPGSAAVRVCVAALACAALTLPAAAKTLRFASAFDPNSLDPHSLALLYQTRVVTQVYEGLVNRDRDYRIEPALATAWTKVGPTTWRFTLRPNVRFHDGSPLSADDVVFSIERALAKTSQRAAQLRGVSGARKVDPLTVDILLEAPDAVLPEKLYLVFIMSRAWSEKNGVLQPQDYNARQETFTVRNANGTGAFALKSYEADRRLVLVANPNWWGRSDKAMAAQLGNVTEAIYTVIQQDATRLAALASGEVDFVIDAPFQDAARLKRDPALKLSETTDLGTQYLGFDQARDELAYSDVKGRNPFKDLRVRRAVAHAIDVDTIVAKVLRGQAKPTGSFISPLARRSRAGTGEAPSVRPGEGARAAEGGRLSGRLRRHAGLRERHLPHGGVPGDRGDADAGRHPRDVPAVAELAVLPQADAGDGEFLRIRLDAGDRRLVDPQRIVRTWDGKGAGQFNGGRYSNARLDAAIDAIRVEPELGRRRALIADALRTMNDDLPLVPLYRRTLTWVMRPNIEVVQWPSDVLELRWVRIR